MMTGNYDLEIGLDDREELACAGLFRRVTDDDWDWRLFPDMSDLKEALPTPRRERRDRLRQALGVVKAARRAGLPVKKATIEGVDLELGDPAPAAPVTELDQWVSEHARAAQGR